ncbi:MAG: hypothetical protein RSA97_02250, partial [Oscillospiraceae bacterium]
MQIYLSGKLRNDIKLSTAVLEKNAARKTSSVIEVKTAAEIKECDYISIKDGDKTLYAGVIMAVKQKRMNMNFAEKVYRLTVADNTDFLKGILTDMQFPEGVNAAQVLMGNKVSQSWYNAHFKQFNGVLETRAVPEGITIGFVSDLSFAQISGPVYLWGMSVFELLDKITSSAGAYWELTSDKVINIYSDSSRPTAPFILDKNAKIFDIKPSRDAYTLYSAVRIIGSTGEGGRLSTKITDWGKTDNPLAQISNDGKELKFKFPVKGGLTLTYCDRNGTDLQVILVGYNAADEADVLASEGSTLVKAKGMFTFPVQSGGGYIFAEYTPLVPIVARIADPTLIAELKAQRGGSGIIEYTLKDGNIKDFSTASELGLKFLKDSSRRAKSVVFKTHISEIFPGMVLKGCNLPYYGILGDYTVGSVTAELLQDGNFEYVVTAATVPYKNASEA